MDMVNVQRTRASPSQTQSLRMIGSAALDVYNLFGEQTLVVLQYWKRMGAFLVKSRHYLESQREDQW